jgi:hypothetical protein
VYHGSGLQRAQATSLTHVLAGLAQLQAGWLQDCGTLNTQRRLMLPKTQWEPVWHRVEEGEWRNARRAMLLVVENLSPVTCVPGSIYLQMDPPLSRRSFVTGPPTHHHAGAAVQAASGACGAGRRLRLGGRG